MEPLCPALPRLFLRGVSGTQYEQAGNRDGTNRQWLLAQPASELRVRGFATAHESAWVSDLTYMEFGTASEVLRGVRALCFPSLQKRWVHACVKL